MFNQRKIGIIGTGKIAGIMARTIKKMKNVKCYAVASRDLSRAQAFAKEFNVKKAYGSYEEMVKDSKIDLVYIATPHSEHYDNMRLCIDNGKNVLCEKAFTANAKQAEEIFSLAKEKNVFVTEAMWTRYMPMLTTIRGIISSGIIGTPSVLNCNLGYYVAEKERMVNPQLAGGALLDLGVYTLNLAAMLFGNDVVKICSSCTMTPSGVDASDSITLLYRDGRMAVLNCTMLGISDRRGVIYGTNGYIEIENINNFESVSVYDKDHKLIKTEKAPKQITGYEYEIMASLEAIDRNATECWEIPHAETLRIMHVMDDLRQEWGVVYPFEEQSEIANETSDEGEETLIENVQEQNDTIEQIEDKLLTDNNIESNNDINAENVDSEGIGTNM